MFGICLLTFFMIDLLALIETMLEKYSAVVK